jgi:hypothetical protein
LKPSQTPGFGWLGRRAGEPSPRNAPYFDAIAEYFDVCLKEPCDAIANAS